MLIVKNTFGVSTSMDSRVAKSSSIGSLGGSSLDRVKRETKPKEKNEIAEELKKPLAKGIPLEKKLRTLSARSKSKIRKKLIAFARLNKKLSFLTLTFVNKVEDELAVKVLRTFLDNAKKRSKDFEYLWVAEKQSKNKAFENNIHFHLVTNKYWQLEKWWGYWLEVQKKYNIIPRTENSKPSSAFDVRVINTANIKGVVNYLSKYVTKNASEFKCQVWNCSKKISRLYTCHYTGFGFIRNLERLEAAGLLGGELKVFPQEYCNIILVPLNRITMPFYNKIDDKNRTVWNDDSLTTKTKKDDK